MLQKLLIISVFSLLLASCSDDLVYEKTLDVPGEAWRYEDTLKFDFDIADTTQLYALFLNVTHAGDYSFQNLYVQFHTTFPSGKTDTKLVSLELAAATGVWNGQCRGNECEVGIPLQAKTRFREAGKHTLAVEQYMRTNPLPGLKSMSLKIRKLKE
jgi:gliding motility-associated lipoprotein GldH